MGVSTVLAEMLKGSHRLARRGSWFADVAGCSRLWNDEEGILHRPLVAGNRYAGVRLDEQVALGHEIPQPGHGVAFV